MLAIWIVIFSSPIGSERGTFSAIGMGAKPQALGGAFTAIADTPDASYWNPAGLSQLSQREISCMQTDLYGMSLLYSSFAFAEPFGSLTAGIAFSGLDAGGAFLNFPYKEGSYLATLSGLTAKNLRWGVNLKYNYTDGGSEFLSSKEQGIGLDFGFLWQRGALALGLTVRDAYTKLSGTLTEDGAQKATNRLLTPDLTVGFSYLLRNLTLALDLSELANNPKLHLGAEYKVNQQVKARAGYSDSGISFGLGLGKGSWLFDYAYTTHAAGDSQRLSLGLKF